MVILYFIIKSVKRGHGGAAIEFYKRKIRLVFLRISYMSLKSRLL